MSLENVKVGDRVWRGNKENRKRILDTVIDLTPQFIRLKSFGRDAAWYRGTGYPRGRATYYITGIACPMEIDAWEITQARIKAAREAQEAARQREQEEKRVRLQELAADLDLPPHDVDERGIYFSYCHRRYQIREVEDRS